MTCDCLLSAQKFLQKAINTEARRNQISCGTTMPLNSNHYHKNLNTILPAIQGRSRLCLVISDGITLKIGAPSTVTLFCVTCRSMERIWISNRKVILIVLQRHVVTFAPTIFKWNKCVESWLRPWYIVKYTIIALIYNSWSISWEIGKAMAVRVVPSSTPWCAQISRNS